MPALRDAASPKILAITNGEDSYALELSSPKILSPQPISPCSPPGFGSKTLCVQQSTPKSIRTICTDLTLDEQQLKSRVRELEVQIRHRVQDEDYDEVERLKTLRDNLMSLARDVDMNHRKLQAAFEQDFISAQALKNEIEILDLDRELVHPEMLGLPSPHSQDTMADTLCTAWSGDEPGWAWKERQDQQAGGLGRGLIRQYAKLLHDYRSWSHRATYIQLLLVVGYPSLHCFATPLLFLICMRTGLRYSTCDEPHHSRNYFCFFGMVSFSSPFILFLTSVKSLRRLGAFRACCGLFVTLAIAQGLSGWIMAFTMDGDALCATGMGLHPGQTILVTATLEVITYSILIVVVIASVIHRLVVVYW